MIRLFTSTAMRAIWTFAGLLALAAAIGLIAGRVAICVAIVSTVYAGVQLWRLARFERWLQWRRTESPPEYEGLWGETIATVHRIYRRKQFHKRRVGRLLREFRRITTAMPEGAALLNQDNEILWFNRHAAQWLKLKRKRDFGMRIENLVRDPVFVEYLRRQEFGEPVTIQMPGSGGAWLSLYLVATRDAPQRLLMVRDVSRQVMLESMRKDFVANASHELRSPLTVISGYLDALGEDTALDQMWREPVSEMRRQAERMRGLIDDLLELSRLENHGEPVVDDSVDAGGLLAVLRKDALAHEQRPATIELSLDSDARLLGSERELSSAFGNLINNAIKYTPVEGAVSIRWWVDEQGGHVSVRDTGIGIAPEHIPRLTERFYRVDAGRSRDRGGFGLGLAIVKHVLQRHEASLEIQSELGSGSTFTCHFPRRRLT